MKKQGWAAGATLALVLFGIADCGPQPGDSCPTPGATATAKTLGGKQHMVCREIHTGNGPAYIWKND